MSSYGRRLVGVTLATAIVCVAIGALHRPVPDERPRLGGRERGPSGVTNLYLGTVPAAELTDPHPTWVSYYVVNADEHELAARHDVRAAGQHARPRDDLPVRRRLGPAQPVHLAGHRHRRRHVPAQRQDDAGDRPRPRVPRVRDPGSRPVGAARGRPRQRQEPLQQRAVPAEHGPRDDLVHVPHARPRACTAGSASSRARPASSRGSADRCRPSATWTASSRSYEGVSR